MKCLDELLVTYLPRFASTEGLLRRHAEHTKKIDRIYCRRPFAIEQLMELLRLRSMIDKELRSRGHHLP